MRTTPRPAGFALRCSIALSLPWLRVTRLRRGREQSHRACGRSAHFSCRGSCIDACGQIDEDRPARCLFGQATLAPAWPHDAFIGPAALRSSPPQDRLQWADEPGQSRIRLGPSVTGDPADAAPDAARALHRRPRVDSQALARTRLWAQKWRWYERNSLPWNRAQIHWQFLRREAFVRWPLHGNVLEALRERRLEIGAGVLLEPGVWITAPGTARVRIGAGSFLNLGVMVASEGLVEIGEHCMLANGCFVSDASHRYDDPDQPITWQGFQSKGPTRIGDNCWLGANVVVTSGVTIGARCVIGANSVVTHDLEPFSIAAGLPARLIKRVEYSSR